VCYGPSRILSFAVTSIDILLFMVVSRIRCSCVSVSENIPRIPKMCEFMRRGSGMLQGYFLTIYVHAVFFNMFMAFLRSGVCSCIWRMSQWSTEQGFCSIFVIFRISFVDEICYFHVVLFYLC